MSEGPVYCPKDKQELRYYYNTKGSGYWCSQCGLTWDGRFPIKDCHLPGAPDSGGGAIARG